VSLVEELGFAFVFVELSWALAAAPLLPLGAELVSPLFVLVELFALPAWPVVSPGAVLLLLYVPGCWAVPLGLFAFEFAALLLLYWLFELSVEEPVVPVFAPLLALLLLLLYWLPSFVPAPVEAEDWEFEPFETEPWLGLVPVL